VYLETSKDILFIVLAFCILWFTAFLCWALYYVITMLRDASRTVGEIRDRVHAIDDAIRGVRERFESSFGSFGALATGLKLAMSYFEKRKEKMKEKVRETAQDLKKRASKIKKKLDEEAEESEDLY
jgi:hypothetical protein